VCREKKRYSESERSSEESDNTSNAGATTWVKEVKTPKFRIFYWKCMGETNSI
jgi:hypothetical protein